jgi:hypothetical protein
MILGAFLVEFYRQSCDRGSHMLNRPSEQNLPFAPFGFVNFWGFVKSVPGFLATRCLAPLLRKCRWGRFDQDPPSRNSIRNSLRVKFTSTFIFHPKNFQLYQSIILHVRHYFYFCFVLKATILHIPWRYSISLPITPQDETLPRLQGGSFFYKYWMPVFTCKFFLLCRIHMYFQLFNFM